MITEHLYYRGEVKVTPELKERILKVFGGAEVGKPYNHFAMLPYFSDSGSCMWRINELMLTIQTDSRLNPREKEIEARIAKGLTKSQGRHYEFVEMGLLHTLYKDAIHQYNKVADERIPYLNEHELDELYELYKIKPTVFPHLKELEKAEAKIALIQEPTEIVPFTLYDFGEHSTYGKNKDERIWAWDSQVTALKTYYVKFIDNYCFEFRKKIKPIYDELPYVYSVSLSYISRGCLEINVVDNVDSDRAFQNVLAWLKKRNFLELA